MNRSGRAAIALVFALAACGAPEAADGNRNGAQEPSANALVPDGAGGQAVAALRTAEGEPAGTATAVPVDGGVTLSLRAEGLPPGRHGAHVHMTGRCEAPGFASAGSHWNPAARQHGLDNPDGQHAGDMPNLVVGEDGRGTLEYRLEGGTLGGLLDGDGSAIVVHASEDDQRTDPSGNSGDRIACGVFAAG